MTMEVITTTTEIIKAGTGTTRMAIMDPQTATTGITEMTMTVILDLTLTPILMVETTREVTTKAVVEVMDHPRTKVVEIVTT